MLAILHMPKPMDLESTAPTDEPRATIDHYRQARDRMWMQAKHAFHMLEASLVVLSRARATLANARQARERTLRHHQPTVVLTSEPLPSRMPGTKDGATPPAPSASLN
jgi:hypothetical protein